MAVAANDVSKNLIALFFDSLFFELAIRRKHVEKAYSSRPMTNDRKLLAERQRITELIIPNKKIYTYLENCL
jgi:hypothetical protein